MIDVTDSFWNFVHLANTETIDALTESEEFKTLQQAFSTYEQLVIYPGKHHVYKDCVEGCYIFDDPNALFHDSVSIILRDSDRELLINCIKSIYNELDMRELMDGIKKM